MQKSIEFTLKMAWFFFIFLLWGGVGIAEGLESPPPTLSQRVIFLTVPKSGTHLLKKAVRLILGVGEEEICGFDSVLFEDPMAFELMQRKMLRQIYEMECVVRSEDRSNLAAFARKVEADLKREREGKLQLRKTDPLFLLKEAQGSIFFDHLWPEYDVLNTDFSDTYIKIVMVRDPRDILISQVCWVREGNPWWMPIALLRAWKELPFEEHLTALIQLPEEYGGIHSFCLTARKWKKYKDVFFCRFEDLVGPLGGGNRQTQESTLRALAEHLRCPLPEWKVTWIADELFGDTYTFRRGQIGRWKMFMTKEQQALCKSIFGDLLVDLGYENNANW